MLTAVVALYEKSQNGGNAQVSSNFPFPDNQVFYQCIAILCVQESVTGTILFSLWNLLSLRRHLSENLNHGQTFQEL